MNCYRKVGFVAHGGHGNDRDFLGDGQPGCARRRHSVYAEKGHGQALIKFLII